MPTCPWCKEEFSYSRRGNQEKRYCTSACKNAWNTAARALGSSMEKLGVLDLRTWYEQHVAERRHGN